MYKGDIYKSSNGSEYLIVEVYPYNCLMLIKNGYLITVSKNDLTERFTLINNIELPKVYELCKYINDESVILTYNGSIVISLLVKNDILIITVEEESDSDEIDYNNDEFESSDYFSLFRMEW